MATYIHFRHTADIYGQIRTTASSGQKRASWALETASQRCDYQPNYGGVRVRPTQNDIENIYIYFPSDISLTTSKRVYNVKDRLGNIIDAGPFEILTVQRHTGFNGSLHHYCCALRRVIE